MLSLFFKNKFYDTGFLPKKILKAKKEEEKYLSSLPSFSLLDIDQKAVFLTFRRNIINLELSASTINLLKIDISKLLLETSLLNALLELLTTWKQPKKTFNIHQIIASGRFINLLPISPETKKAMFIDHQKPMSETFKGASQYSNSIYSQIEPKDRNFFLEALYAFDLSVARGFKKNDKIIHKNKSYLKKRCELLKDFLFYFEISPKEYQMISKLIENDLGMNRSSRRQIEEIMIDYKEALIRDKNLSAKKIANHISKEDSLDKVGLEINLLQLYSEVSESNLYLNWEEAMLSALILTDERKKDFKRLMAILSQFQ